MNKCIAFADDDERFLELSREHLTCRGYDVLGYRDSRTAFDAILRQKNRIDWICVDQELFGSQDEPSARQKEHLAELPALAVREIAAFQDHLVQTVGIVDNYNRIKGPPFAAVDVVSVANACLARLRPEADAKRLVISAAI